ncbi:MAG: transporter substrate-binding domain-containing protein [Odoribacter sp.]|nr:transporter substrate-binding domain-containing protein [Odoribacter sp.]
MWLRKIILYTLLLLCTACQESSKETPEFLFPASSPVEKILAKGFLDVSTFYSTTDYYIYKGITRGFHYELAQSFADFLGVKLRILEVNNNLDSAIHHLRKGKYDLIAVSMTVTPERKEKIKFASPLFETGEVLVQNKKKETIHQVTDLNGKTIFIKKDGPYKNLLNHLQDSLQIQFKISEVSGYSSEDLLHLVESGEINYLVTDRNIAQALSSSMPDIDYSVSLREGITISWATNPVSNDLSDEINTWLSSYKRSGKLNMVYNRYFNNRNPQNNHKSKYSLVKKGDISPFDKQLKQASKSLNWDWRLLAALVYNESKFDPEAESYVGAYGLMQVIPETANMFNVFDYFTPDSNIYTGVQYLKYLDNIFSEYPISPQEKLKFTLASYNVGAGHVKDAMRLAEKYGKNPYVWDNNVDFYLRHKTDPEFYRDPLSRNGYCNGQQAYDYVHRILDTYNNYKHIRPQ